MEDPQQNTSAFTVTALKFLLILTLSILPRKPTSSFITEMHQTDNVPDTPHNAPLHFEVPPQFSGKGLKA